MKRAEKEMKLEKKYRIAIVGGRDFNDYQKMIEETTRHLRNKCYTFKNYYELEIVTGDAKGADSLAKLFAESRGIEVTIFRADWHIHGKGAGPIRNKKMASYCDEALAFWDGKSKGTGNMVREMIKTGKRIKCVYY